ncbi:MAG: amidohydrolase family protein, partial [Phycisphaerales bacterium]|nr:amidohydrolase family protein [Phycisphaerales bacterium]
MKPRILIENGLLFTGSADDKAAQKHVFIEDGQIKTISSDRIAVPDGTERIDATGKWVTPGFIDSHTHYDAELVASPGLKESARHGVSTILLGSCSVSAIYNSPEDTADTFTRVEAIPREVMLPLLAKEKTWNTPSEWVEYINRLPLGVNIASFIGHSDLRSKAMGMARSVTDNEVATEAEQARMND